MNLSIRTGPGLLAGALALSGCLPAADFKVTVRVIDEESGAPIPDALILAGAHVAVEPPMRPPYDSPVAAARGFTDADGTLRIRRVEGMYAGEKPPNKLYKMLESRLPKLKHRVTGVKSGSILVLAPGYGLLEQAFYLEGNDKPSHGWLGAPGAPWYRDAIPFAPKAAQEGFQLTVKFTKPKRFDEAYAPFGIDTVIRTLDLSSKLTGTDQGEKDRIWKFFIDQLEYAVAVSSQPYYLRQLKKFKEPEAKRQFDTLSNGGTESDATLYRWLTQRALERLPQECEEAKQFAMEIMEGVAAEGGALRSQNHFYDPSNPEKAFPRGQPAPVWGAIGHPDNPGNDYDWADAQRYYREGDRARAYRAVGHVLRLIENLAVPRYALPGRERDFGFEEAVLSAMKGNGGTLAPEYWIAAREPLNAKTSKERFDAVAGLAAELDPGELEARLPTAAVTNGQAGGAWEAAAKKSFPPAIGHAAGLLRDFHRLMHPPAFVQAPGDGNGGDGQNNVTRSTDTNGAINRQELTPVIDPTHLPPKEDAMVEDFKKLVSDTDSAHEEVRMNASRKLVAAGAAALPALADCARAGAHWSARRCIGLLALFNQPAAYKAIKSAAINHAEWGVRAHAIDQIARSKSSELIQDLYSLAQTDAHTFCRVTAVRHLGYRGGKAALDMLRQLYVQEKSIQVKLNIARELGDYGDKSGRALALKALKEEKEWRVRDAAIYALGTTCIAEDITLVEAINRDSKEFIAVRNTAWKVLPQMRYESLPEAKKWEHLIASLSSDERRIRVWATIQLRSMRTPQARKTLEDIASRPEHPSSYFAQRELETLKEDFGE